MRRFCPLVVGLLGWAALAGADAGKPAAPPSPLRLLPSEADLVLQLRRPANLVEIVTRLDLVARLSNLAAVKDQLDSTQGRRTRQLVAHFEKALGMKWQQALERLAAGGAAAGVKIAGNDSPAVLVVQGDDEALAEKFLATALEVVEGELARQESKEKIDKGDYHGVQGYKLGNLFFARVGATLVAANKKEAMAAAIDLHLGKGKKSLVDHPALREAESLLPEAPLATAWLNMATVQKSPQAKALYKSPRDDSILTVLFGGYLDLLGRTPFLCGALSEEKDGFLLTARMPRGTDGMGGDRGLHLPPEGTNGRPLLEPKGVLYSSCFYRDLSKVWTDREKLFTKAQADALVKNDTNSGRFLAGIKVSTLLESVGGRHRFVAVNPERRSYKREPQLRLPAFAVVAELRQPEKFARSMDTILRTVALFATDTFKMELVEEKYAGHDLVGYRFDEKAEVKDDVNDIRYNFTPCFARVKDQFLFCSTMDLCKELIDRLADEEKALAKSTAYSTRDRFYAEGFAELLRSIDDQLITQTILDRAASPAEAKKQVDEAIAFVRGLGALTTEARFDPQRFRFDVRLRLKK